VFARLVDLQEAIEPMGLHLKLAKCKLWGLGSQTTSDPSPRYSHGLAEDHPARAVPVVPSGGQRGITALPHRRTEGVPREETLGGTGVLIRVGKGGGANKLALGPASGVPGRSSATGHLAVLLACMPGRSPPPLHRVRGGGRPPCNPPGKAARGRTRPTRDKHRGGNLVASMLAHSLERSRHLGPACVATASRVAALLNLDKSGTSAVGVPAEALLTPAPDPQGSLGALQSQVGPHQEPLASLLSGTSALSPATNEHTTQKWWAEKVVDMQSQRLDSSGTARDRTRRVCQKGPVATGWLGALLNNALRTEIPDIEFRLLLRWWLGIPILPSGETLPRCPLCMGSIYPFGDHFVGYEQNGCTQRHNAFRDAFQAMCVRYGIAVQK
jgi:hypothetical protein